MFFSVLAFVLGIIVVQQFSVLPETYWILGLFLLLPCFVFFRYWRLMFFTIGVLWAICFASMRLADRLPDSLQGQPIQIEGKIVGLPQYDDRRVRFDFEVSKPEHHFPEKIRLSWYFPKQTIKTGQFWHFTVKLKKPHGRFNPGGFDYEKWLFTQNIGASGYVKNSPQPRLIAITPLWKSYHVLRQTIADELSLLLKHSNNMGIIKALTIGDRHDISTTQWDVFRKTGTVHLMAISGLHIGLISGLAYFFSLKCCLRFAVVSPQKVAAIVAIFVALIYSALAGFSLPTQRALLMLTIAMMAMTWQRNMTAVNTLALAMLGILIFDPLAVLSVGFWLSFLAVVLIVYCLAGRLGRASYWQGTIRIHWVTALGLAPLLLFNFQQVSVIAPLANFITVPVISLLVVPLCLLAVLLMFLWSGFAADIFFIVNKILQGLGFVLSEMAAMPFATATISSPPYYSLLFALLGVLILLSPKGMPARWLGVVLFTPLLFVEIEKPKRGEVVMTLLDVGQGLAAVIETTNHTLVFDTGAKYSQVYDMGNAVVIPFLKSKGIQLVDFLLISHGDNDHIGGAESILRQNRVSKVLTSVPDKLDKYDPTHCIAGQSWVWDGVDFEVLSPGKGFFVGENNNSCVLKVNSKQGSILLTGDIEVSAEDWLVENMAQKIESDILIAPHHGSKTSSTLLFLKQVNPSIILIPSGYKNRFSFPHKEVLKRYKSMNSTWMNTAVHGAITVKITKSVIVNSARLEHSKYWNK